MVARSLQKTSRHKKAFEYFMKESEKAIEIYFLIPRGEHSDRFINKLESNTELNVCVWDAKDQFKADSADKLSSKNVKGKNFEWRIEGLWDGEDPSWDRTLVEPFIYESEHDRRVKEFLENDNPYFCAVGMKINWNDYLERDPCRDYTILLIFYVVVPYLKA
ncbi:hypothetical protein FOXB_05059 [Fusarium oxysporum f. sp. conglutinans Fo5176]|uniref:Uncharacterized protein n=1 Tax=Fusarium oxysporum (strain Fo5176) TaxID=660025 RepID=F9FF80_FUSOF|nr:hypothetical protein FOXB_05059 [Fusarium oxysporum f. sp. conglutinans Fo5176]